MRRIVLLLFTMIIICHKVNAQNNVNQNVNQNINNNSNTIIIQNQPVITKEKYIEKYRTVYVDRPKPKRVARRLPAPICLQNFLWVYPEDLGTFIYGPKSIIAQINAQGQYGRNNWRVPSSEELRLMENYANECGLGEGIYLATEHRNGILRLVSTGKSIAQQQEDSDERERIRRAEEKYQRELKEQSQRNAALEADYIHSLAIANQNSLITSGTAVLLGETVWCVKNRGANSPTDKGVLYSMEQVVLAEGWRLPTEDEFYLIFRQSKIDGDILRMNNGLVVPIGTYAVQLKDGHIGYMNLSTGFTGYGGASVFVRYVQDRLH